MFDAPIDTRSLFLGSDTLEEKTNLLKKLEKEIQKVIDYYNVRMDLRNKRFAYIEWGMFTGKYMDEYIKYKNRYLDIAVEFNEKIKKFPFKGIAKKKGYKELPLIGENKIAKVKLNKERYTREKK